MSHVVTSSRAACLAVGLLGALASTAEPARRSAAAQCPVDGVAVQPADSLLLATAAAVVRSSPEIASLWPGFWSADEAFVLTIPGETVLLVTAAAAPPPFLPLCGAGLPDVLAGRAHIHRGVIPALVSSRGRYFDLDAELGDLRVTAVSLTEDVPSSVHYLVHEAFHAYQLRHFAPARRNEAAVPDDVLSDPEFNQLAELEWHILRAALQAQDSAERTELLLDYAAVRHSRLAAAPEAVRLNEEELEAHEGSAEYIGSYAEAFAGGHGRDVLPPRVAEWFGDSALTRLAAFSNVHWRHRGRVYGTGAGIAVLLERLGVEWQTSLQQGQSFLQVLERAIGFDTARHAARAEDVIRRHRRALPSA